MRYYIFKTALKLIILTAVSQGVIFLNGCAVSKPGARLGSYATATLGTHFLDTNCLGRHHFGSSCFEKNGIVYTCKGGHIDIAHARIAADNVRYLQDMARKNLLGTSRNFDFKLKVEPSTYYVTLEYPQNWKKLSKKDRIRIADEVSMEMGAYLTYIMTTWHEVLTWFGFKCMAIVPEQPSAFSWEDVYSNVFGIKVGTQALQDKKHGYNTAVTIALEKELKNLGIQSKDTARKASEKMRGTWYEGALIAEMKVRNLDIGIDDGFVTPMLVPGVCRSAVPEPLPVPNLYKFHKYGFKMTLEVEMKELEKDRVLRIIYLNVSPNEYPKRIQPVKHLPAIMDYIKRKTEKKRIGKPRVNKPLHFPDI
jgi:hypothetical protein